MNLNDLANLGQIVGAIGVMITPVYLAIQLRGNTKVASAFSTSSTKLKVAQCLHLLLTGRNQHEGK